MIIWSSLCKLFNMYFKLVFTCVTRNYSFSPRMKVKDMLEFIQLNSRADFNICSDDVEIIEVGETEYGDAIDIDLVPDDQTLVEKYGENYDSVAAFYIRSRNQVIVNR